MSEKIKGDWSSFRLTETQNKAIGRQTLEMLQASEDGNPGVIVAQIVNGVAVVKFIPNEQAKALIEAWGGDTSKRISDWHEGAIDAPETLPGVKL